MLYREIARTLGYYLYFLAATLCVPLLLALYFEYLADPATHPQPHSSMAFGGAVFICLAIAEGLRYMGRHAEGHLYRREGLAVVVSIWFLSAFVGGLPFFLSGTLSNPLDAYFEAMSGFTTTGATVMHPKAFDDLGNEVAIEKTLSEYYDTDYVFYGTVDPVVDPETGEVLYTGVEAVSKALLFWRSFMQWLGGMGIVVLFVAILPLLGVGGKVLFQAEVPGPVKEAITPRVKETASLLWKLYLSFSLVEVALLLWTNAEMSIFDAVCITLSNVSTGGFSTHNASIAYFDNPSTEWVIIVFMLIGSINFALYFYCLRGQFYRLYEPEFILYTILLLVFSSMVTWNLMDTEKILLDGQTGIFSSLESVRYGFFHLISAQTSTGFATSDFDKWPYVNQALLLTVMFLGSMSGSTGGGIKVVRHFMLFKIAQNKVESIFRPERVRSFRISGKMVDSTTATTVLCFFLIVASLSVLGTLLLALNGVDLETSLTVTTCMLNNIGLAFRMAGPTESFAFLPAFGKILSCCWMVLGRLEFYAVLVILIPAFWREH